MESICRICLKTTSSLNNIFDENLPYKIEMISNIQICPNDKLPHNLCLFCKSNVHLLYKFRNDIIYNNAVLLKRLKTSAPKKEEIIKVENKQETNVKIYEDHDSSNDTPDEKYEDVLIDGDNYDDTNAKCENVDDDSNHILNEENVDIFVEDASDTYEDNNVTCEINIHEDTNTEISSNEPLVHEGSNIKKIVKSLRIYRCKFCKFETQLSDKFNVHKKKHMPSPTSLCNICGKFVTTYNFNKHLMIHSDETATCEICGKVLKNIESLRGHMHVHKNVKYECKICHKEFGHRTAVNSHMKRHALGNTRPHECTTCKKRFFIMQDLKKHMRSHTGERPYPCQYCKKGFSSTYALRTHIRQHTNEKPFACTYCGSAFHQRVSLRTHLKSKHSNESCE